MGFMYDLGFSHNMNEAFGINWKFAWISPLIPSPLPGNGIDFKARDIVAHSGKEM